MPSDPSSAWWRELERYPHLRGALARAPARAVVADARVVDSAPRLAEDHDPVNAALYALLAHARRNAVVVTPYLVLIENAAAAFEAAGRRGLSVTVLTNSPGGVRNEHAKFAVFDDEITMLGSNNLDP